MKKMKIVSGLMAMTMALVSMSVSASAAGGVQIKVGNESVKAGGTFAVDVELASVPSSGLSSIDFAISYDASVVEITDVKLGAIGNTGAAEQEGDLGDTLFDWYDNGSQVVVVWATGLTDSKYWINSDGTFITISGKAASGAKDGASTDLKVVAADREAYPGGAANAEIVFSAVGEGGKTEDFTADATSGKVTVGDGTTNPDPGDADWGNANCTDGVDVADAVLVARYAGSDATAKITTQGITNSDVTHDGKVDGSDVAKILQFIAKQITKDDLAKA